MARLTFIIATHPSSLHLTALGKCSTECVCVKCLHLCSSSIRCVAQLWEDNINTHSTAKSSSEGDLEQCRKAVYETCQLRSLIFPKFDYSFCVDTPCYLTVQGVYSTAKKEKKTWRDIIIT